MTARRDLSEMSFEELDLQVSEGKERLRRRRAAAGSGEAAVTTAADVPPEPEKQFPPETLLWLALAPSWTLKMAEACGFPARPGFSVEETLEALGRDGLARKGPLPSLGNRGSHVDCYEMTSGARSRLLAPYQTNEEALRSLRGILAHIGRSILNASQAEADLTPPLRRWATLVAQAEDADAVAVALDQQTAAAFDSKRSDELLNWIDTGRPLAAFYRSELEAPIKLALQKASRRLELFFRREIDEKHLQESRFFERDDQIGAFKKFMEGPPEEWALHFVGAGGVGKTMLMRKITTGLADEMGAITARVDFDYFNADYPRLAPGVLLWSFGQELRPYDQQNTVIGLLDDADRTLRDLHKRLSAGLRSEAERPTRHPLFRTALIGYISALKALSKQLGRKVLLIVDTCEELARSRPDGTVPENVEETFRILRALHDGPQALVDDNSPPDNSRGLPDLKVIFSGRRVLGEKGLGWHLKYTEETPRPGRVYVERSYLRLFEIRGFTHDEARHYLTSDPDMPNNPQLLEAIIARSSPEAGGLKGLVFEEGSRAAEVVRCHPYEFIFYRDWAKEKPPPSAQTIRTATSIQYVELRILKRLRNAPLEALMPAVALLGRFNRETLEAVSSLDREDFEKAFENLQRQDWIDLRSEATSDGKESRLVLNAEHGVRKRLLAYYYMRGDLNLVQAKAADYLERATLHDDLSRLDWSSFDAALRVLDLDPDPARAARWWESVVERVLTERDWTWLDTLLSYLRAEDGAAGLREANANVIAIEQIVRDSDDAPDNARTPDSLEPPESCMRPAVLATYAAALNNRRGANRSELYEVWRQVSERAEAAVGDDYDAANPNALRLLMRARAGLIISSRHLGTPPEPQYVKALWQTIDLLTRQAPSGDVLDEQVLAALVAAVETIVEHVEVEVAKGRGKSAQSLFFLTSEDQSSRAKSSNARKIFGPYKLVNVLEAYQPAHVAWLAALQAFAYLLSGRALAFSGLGVTSISEFEDALRIVNATPLEKAQPRLGWFDWQPPGDIASRVRLEFVRSVCPRRMSPDQLLKVAEEWPEVVSQGVDADRLRSALIGVRLRCGPIEPDTLNDIQAVVRSAVLLAGENVQGVEGDACEAHRNVPPLFIAVADALTAEGRPDEAMRLLNNVLSRSQELGPSVTLQAERAHARLARLMRTYENSPREYETMEKSGRVADVAIAWALDGLRGRKNQKAPPTVPTTAVDYDRFGWIHAFWQSRFTLGEARQAAIEWASANMASPGGSLPSADHDFLTWSLFLDSTEAEAVAKQVRGNTQLIPPWRWLEKLDTNAWFKLHPDQPEEALALSTRRMLMTSNRSEVMLQLDLSKRVGARRVAEIVLQECELLALRMPHLSTFSAPLTNVVYGLLNSEDHVSVVTLGLADLMLRKRPAIGPDAGLQMRKVDAALTALSESSVRNRPAQGLGTLPQEGAANVEVDLAVVLPMNYAKSLATRCWRPWLVRYALLKADSTGDVNRRKDHVTLLRRRLLGFPPSEAAETTVLLPPDLEQWFGKPKEDSIFWKVVGILSVLFVVLGLFAVGGFYLLQWLLSFTPFDISGMRLGLRIGFYVALLPVIGFMVWRVYVETRETLAEAKKEETAEPVSIFKGWKSTAPLAAVFILCFTVLELKLGHWAYPRWLGGGWFERLNGPGATNSFWQVAWTVLVGGGVLLPAIFLAFRGFRTFRRQLTTAFGRFAGLLTTIYTIRLRVRVAAGATATRSASRTEVPPVEIRQEMRLPQWLSVLQIYLDRLEPPPTAQVTIPPLATYGEIAAQADSKQGESYAWLVKTLRRRTIQIQLDIASHLHAPCWEALVVLPQRGETRSPRDLPFRFRRTSEARRALWLKRARAVVFSWTDSHVAEQVAARGWRGLSYVNGFGVHLSREEYDLFKTEVVSPTRDGVTRVTAPMVGVLHLVGTPEDTGEGVRFRLARNEVTTQIRSKGGPLLLDAESLAERFTNLSLCVLQGDPDKWEKGERSDDARGKAMLARIFASKLFDLDVPAVLVIPPLKAQLGADALAVVASVLARRSRRGTRALTEAVALIQEMIVNSYDSPADEAWEEALDTCLYAVKDWNGRLKPSASS